MAAEKAAALGLKPLARIMGAAAAGVDSRIMGMGPVVSTQRLMPCTLGPQGYKLEDFELFELNEAFAAQAVACVKELRFKPERVNVNGGAIALGHPLGCTGTRISTTLIHEMQKRGVRYGMAQVALACQWPLKSSASKSVKAPRL